MKTQKFAFIWLVSIALILAACKGPSGPDGPVGPAGPTGTSGTTGATGLAGPAGTANVIYSDWISVLSTSWISSTFNGVSSHFYAITPAISITQTNIDKGVILVYADFFGGTASLLLPYLRNFGTINDDIFPLIELNKITIEDVHHGTSLAAPSFTTRFRYVVIPGAVSGGRAMAPVDYSDYEAVKAYYNIPD